MRSAAVSVLVASAVVAGCGSASSPTTPVASPTPPPPARLLSATLPAGSTVAVSPMGNGGQQAPTLAFRGAITVDRSVAPATAQAFVRTAGMRCMGGGQAHLSFTANVEKTVDPLSMSRTASDAPLCALPYTTTHVELVVLDNTTGQVVLAHQIPAVYHFVAAP